MRILVISGSRNPQGQTGRAAKAFLEGVASAGGQGDIVFLPPMKIERCRQCEDDGWGICRSDGRCVIEDDFASLVEGIKAADVIAFATPVYFSDLSESLRAFLDRLRRTCVNETGRERIEGKPAIGICVAGGGGGGSPECAARLDWTLRTSSFNVVDMILVRRQNLDAQLGILRAAGEWVVTP